MVDLPPLPVDNYVDEDGLWSERRGPYSEDQMREYGEACYRAGLSKGGRRARQRALDDMADNARELGLRY
jgi:hypothetical protein